jgi:adenylate cyclase
METDDRQGYRTTEIVERPPAQRPVHDTVEGISDWLAGAALQVISGAQAVDELAWRMLAAGFPLLRFTVHSGTLHPQFLGTLLVWGRDSGRTQQTFVAHEVGEAVAYEKNPVARVIRGGETLRRRLYAADCAWDLPILRDLEAKGATEYLALPIQGAHARRYMTTFTTDRSGGFSEREVNDLMQIAQRMSVVCDTFSQRALTRHLLDAYLGSNAGRKVLDGQIRRGTGEQFDVVLWSSDLRAYTERSDRLPGQQMIAILNALFDVQATSIHKHGGEILKFIGDGLLAIFPVDDARHARHAANEAMQAAVDGLAAVSGLSGEPFMQAEPALSVVVALHAGSVIYGNVGAADRLDFTVIGPAVNLVSRVENVAKMLNEPIVVTDDFARAYEAPLRSLGRHTFRGVAAPRELFAPQRAPASASSLAQR